MDVGGRGDVESPRRLVGEDQLAERPAPAPGSPSACCRPRAERMGASGPATAHVEGCRCCAPPRPDVAFRRNPKRCTAGVARVFEDEVLGDRHAADAAFVVAVLRDATHAASHHVSRGGPVTVFAEDRQAPPAGLGEAGDQGASAPWPLPDTPAMPTISRHATVERDVCAVRRAARSPVPFTLEQHHGAARVAALGLSPRCSGPTMRSARRARSTPSAGLSATLRPPRSTDDPMAKSDDLGELVADEDDGEAARGKRRTVAKRPSASMPASAPRWARRGSALRRRGREP